MSMQSQTIPSGRPRADNPAGVATIAVTVMLGILALLGMDLTIVTLLALVVLGSILILTDHSIKAEPIALLV